MVIQPGEKPGTKKANIIINLINASSVYISIIILDEFCTESGKVSLH